jgi:ribosomal protein S18 acetylase RimI-like enzyme
MTTSPGALRVRPYSRPRDEAWAAEVLASGLGGRLQARRGRLVDVLDDEGLVAEVDGSPTGLLAFRSADRDDIELAALVVTTRGQGIGSALVDSFLAVARSRGAARVWVVTTNDNLDALRLYQRRGFRITTVRPGAVDDARETVKPSIGRVAANGIPIRDEIELAIDLHPDGAEP